MQGARFKVVAFPRAFSRIAIDFLEAQIEAQIIASIWLMLVDRPPYEVRVFRITNRLQVLYPPVMDSQLFPTQEAASRAAEAIHREIHEKGGRSWPCDGWSFF